MKVCFICRVLIWDWYRYGKSRLKCQYRFFCSFRQTLEHYITTHTHHWWKRIQTKTVSRQQRPLVAMLVPVLSCPLLPPVVRKFLHFFWHLPTPLLCLSSFLHRLCQRCIRHLEHPQIHPKQIHFPSSAMRSLDLLRPLTSRTHADRTSIHFQRDPPPHPPHSPCCPPGGAGSSPGILWCFWLACSMRWQSQHVTSNKVNLLRINTWLSCLY